MPSFYKLTAIYLRDTPLDGQRKIRYRILGALDVTGLTARHPNQSRRWVRLASFNLAL
jgi:hypothetical protein